MGKGAFVLAALGAPFPSSLFAALKENCCAAPAHGAHADEDELPADSEVFPALEAVEASFRWIFR